MTCQLVYALRISLKFIQHFLVEQLLQMILVNPLPEIEPPLSFETCIYLFLFIFVFISFPQTSIQIQQPADFPLQFLSLATTQYRYSAAHIKIIVTAS